LGPSRPCRAAYVVAPTETSALGQTLRRSTKRAHRRLPVHRENPGPEVKRMIIEGCAREARSTPEHADPVGNPSANRGRRLATHPSARQTMSGFPRISSERTLAAKPNVRHNCRNQNEPPNSHSRHHTSLRHGRGDGHNPAWGEVENGGHRREPTRKPVPTRYQRTDLAQFRRREKIADPKLFTHAPPALVCELNGQRETKVITYGGSKPANNESRPQGGNRILY